MKVAFVLDTMVYGGIERISINYLKMLINNGYSVDVYILTPKVDKIVEEIPTECKIIYINFPRYFSPDAYWRLAEKYSWGKYILPLAHLVLSISRPLLRLIKGKRKLYDIAIAFSGHFNDITYVLDYIRSEKRVCWLHGSLFSYITYSHGYASLYEKVKNLVVLSNDKQEEIVRKKKWDDFHITKIYNPITIQDNELSEEKIEELKLKHGEFLLMVARFTSQKDQITVIKSVKILKEKYYKEIKVLFVGDGPDRENAKKYAEILGISDLVIFEGTQSDVQNYYKAAKLFVHSSPAEGLPTVLLEAMTFGLPIIATDSKPGVREILGENKYGLICPVKDEDSMAENINILLHDEKLYNFYKQKGYERVRKFQPNAINKELNKLLSEIKG